MMDAAKVRAMVEASTPGPWRWELSKHSKTVELAGSRSDGRENFGYSVMRFVRWGLQSAAPEFWTWTKNIGDTFRADMVCEPVPGREHHKEWFQTVSHPNAALIAAAPDLAAEVLRLTEEKARLLEDVQILLLITDTVNARHLTEAACEKIGAIRAALCDAP